MEADTLTFLEKNGIAATIAGAIAAILSYRLHRRQDKQSKYQAARNSVAPTENLKGLSRLPRDIVFSDRVLMLPGLPKYFDTALWHMQPRGGYYASPSEHPRSLISTYQWVERGDAVFSMRIAVSASKDVTVNIKSPVSGLFMFHTLHFFDGDSPRKTDYEWHPILLAEGEPAPDAIEYMYGELYSVLFANISYIHRYSKRLKGYSKYQPYSQDRLIKLRDSLPEYHFASFSKDFSQHAPYLEREIPGIHRKMSPEAARTWT